MSSISLWATARTSFRTQVARACLRSSVTVASRSFITTSVNVVRHTSPLSFRYASTSAQAAEAPEVVETSADEPVELFSSLEGKVDPRTLKALTQTPFKYETMSPVQARILPRLPDLVAPREEGNPKSIDLLVKARTGTGKTIGFLVPAIEARIRELEAIANQPSSQTAADADKARGSISRRYAMDNVGALIISPTRELASQIAVEAQKLTSHIPGFGVSLFVGGVDKFRQGSQFDRSRKDILVATPGRLKDFLSDPRSGVKASLKNTKMLILDEADTLLDMGFREDIESIMRDLPSSETRHTLLFSATVSKGIQQIANNHLAPGYEFVNCVSEDTSEVHDHIPQFHTVLPGPEHQVPHLMRLLMQDQIEHGDKSKVILFLPTTKMTMLTSSVLHDLGRNILPSRTDIFELHSKRTMNARTKAAEMFRTSRRASILVTSDVSARGVDYPGVTRVIQLGLPKSAEQYVHRVGRTGRGSSRTGRGDLVLLDWEHEFARRNFTHLPLKPLSVKDFAAEVAAQLEAADHPAKTRLTTVHAELDSTIDTHLKSRVDQEAVGDTMMSMIGFYAGLTQHLKVNVDGVVEELKKWSTVGMGLDRAPFVSSSFLAKVGGGKSDRGGGHRSERRPFADRERTFGQKREWRSDGGGERSGRPWESRGEGSSAPFGRREGGASRPWEERGSRGGARSFGGRDSERSFERRSRDADGEEGAERSFVKRSFSQPRSFGDSEGGESGGGFRRRGEYAGRRTRSYEARNGKDSFESPF